MLTKLVSYIDRLEALTISPITWVTTFFAIGMGRTFLETLSTRTEASVATTDFATIIHYLYFYVTIILALTLVGHFFSGKAMRKVSNVALVSFSIVFFPPLFDLVLSRGEGGIEIGYLFVPASALFSNFITFFGDHTLPGVTPGMRIELFLIILFTGTYVYFATKSVVRTLGSMLTTYGVFFVLGALPSIIAALAVGEISPGFYWLREMRWSLVEQNFFHPGITFPDIRKHYEMYFNGAILQVLFIISLPLALLTAYRFDSTKTRAVLANIRPERVAIYLGMTILGMVLATVHTDTSPISSWVDVATILCLLISVAAIWVHAVCHNDLMDAEGDRITNANRPLITGTLTASDMKIARTIFLGIALIGGYAAGHYVLFTILTFAALAYLYSSPPIHLKRFPIINPLVTGVCMLLVTLAGFFTLSTDDHTMVFPMSWGVLIVLFYTLIANVKDIKDIASDKHSSTYTIPVLFGEYYGKRIIGILVIGALQLIPLMTGYAILWWTSIPFGIGAYALIMREPYHDRHLFYFFILFAITSTVLVIFS